MPKKLRIAVACALIGAAVAAVALAPSSPPPAAKYVVPQTDLVCTIGLFICTSTSSGPTPTPAPSATPSPTSTATSTTSSSSSTTTAPGTPAQSGRCNPPAPNPYPVNGDAKGGPDEIISPATGVDTCIGYYEDTSGQTPLTQNNAAIEGPATRGGRANGGAAPSFLYFVGHDMNTIFRPFHNAHVGDLIYFWDAEWNAPMPHVYRITNISRNVPFNSQPFPILQGSAETIQIQTCEDGTTAYDEIIDGVDN